MYRLWSSQRATHKGVLISSCNVSHTPTLSEVLYFRQYSLCFRSEPECTDFGPLNVPLTRVSRYLRAMSPTRLAIAIVILVGLIGLVVFLGVFPASFVYVEYHEVSFGDLGLIFLIDYPIHFDTTSMELSILSIIGLQALM